MAENKNPKIKEETKKPIELPETKTYSLSADDLTAMVAAAVKGALESQPKQAKSESAYDPNRLNMRLQSEINKRLQASARFNQQLFTSKEKREIVIDEIYAEYVSNFITSTINGNTVKVPVDGQPYLVHPAHYRAIRERLNHVSRQRKRNANVTNAFGTQDTGDFQKI